jgi:acetylornithine/succinyldiaminopimelate/putrescine aminotransferase
MAELDQIIDSRTYQSIVDYEASNGNYIIDADGNVHLDVFAQIASIAVGYNNPDLLALSSTVRLPLWPAFLASNLLANISTLTSLHSLFVIALAHTARFSGRC